MGCMDLISLLGWQAASGEGWGPAVRSLQGVVCTPFFFVVFVLVLVVSLESFSCLSALMTKARGMMGNLFLLVFVLAY